MKIRLARTEDAREFLEEIIMNPVIQRKLNSVGVKEYFLKSDTWNVSFVGEEAGKLVGFVQASFYSPVPSVAIDEIFILKKYRKNGYARELIEFAMKFAKASWNPYYIYAYTIDNRQAERLFKKLGFKNRGRYKNFYRRNGRKYSQTFWQKEL